MAQGIARHNFKEPASYLVTAVPVVSTAWSLINNNGKESFSNLNLTVLGTGGNGMGGATGSFTSGQKIFWEQTDDVDSGTSGVAVGIINSTFNPNTAPYLGGEGNSFSYFDNGQVVFNNTLIATISAYTTGARIGCCYDNGLAWFTLDGVTFNNDIIINQNPIGRIGGISTGVTGPFFPAYSVNVFDQQTANFGATTFGYSTLYATLQAAGYTTLP